MKWVFLSGLALFLMLAAWLVFNDFADVPCQDGVWNSAKQRCLPMNGLPGRLWREAEQPGAESEDTAVH